MVRFDSPIEKRLYEALLPQFPELVSQFSIGFYCVDMAIPSLKVAIECDGIDYHSSSDQCQYDHHRTRYLLKQGWIVIRFMGADITRDLNQCVKDVYEIVQTRKEK